MMAKYLVMFLITINVVKMLREYKAIIKES